MIQGRPEVDFFYDNYVRPGKPVVIKNAMKNWRAIESWTDAYLKEKIGDKLVKVRCESNRKSLHHNNIGNLILLLEPS